VERTITGIIREGSSLRQEIDRFLVWWCLTMHDNITWPRRGHYQCKTCGRTYAVPWREQRRPVPATVIPIHSGLEHARTA
jgi:hypothetical protein